MMLSFGFISFKLAFYYNDQVNLCAMKHIDWSTLINDSEITRGAACSSAGCRETPL